MPKKDLRAVKVGDTHSDVVDRDGLQLGLFRRRLRANDQRSERNRDPPKITCFRSRRDISSLEDHWKRSIQAQLFKTQGIAEAHENHAFNHEVVPVRRLFSRPSGYNSGSHVF